MLRIVFLSVALVAGCSSDEASPTDAGADARADGFVDASSDAARDAGERPDLGGMCEPSCNVGEECCGAPGTAMCVTTFDDAENCGACGNSCLHGKGTACASGTCVCGEILEGCGGSRRSTCCPPHDAIETSYCANFDEDPTDCGGCGVACDSTQSDRCAGGHCYCGSSGALCAGTAEDLCCLNAFEDGVCVNTTNDVRNCGECGHVCNLGLGEVCVTGTCMAPGA